MWWFTITSNSLFMQSSFRLQSLFYFVLGVSFYSRFCLPLYKHMWHVYSPQLLGSWWLVQFPFITLLWIYYRCTSVIPRGFMYATALNSRKHSTFGSPHGKILDSHVTAPLYLKHTSRWIPTQPCNACNIWYPNWWFTTTAIEDLQQILFKLW
jgi:hypothetical protein